MTSIEGLNLDIKGDANQVDIDESSKFSRSRITVTGSNNKIKLGQALNYNNLILNLKGNNKTIAIEETGKNINGLKIVSIRGDNQIVTIGKNFSCGGLEIQMNDGDEALAIGNDCLFSWGLKMRTSDGHSIIDLETGQAINSPKNIEIGSHVWIGEDVKVLKGGKVPNNTVVGSFSVITKPFSEENTILAGTPAKIVKEGINWDREMPSKFNAKIKS